MPPLFICPHCHSPIDPQNMDVGHGLGGEYRICPDCDQPILLGATASPTSNSPYDAADPAASVLAPVSAGAMS
jgi:hypothetical protein